MKLKVFACTFIFVNIDKWPNLILNYNVSSNQYETQKLNPVPYLLFTTGLVVNLLIGLVCLCVRQDPYLSDHSPLVHVGIS